MMTIDFHCPRCGLDLHAPEVYQGGQARCQNCGTQVRVPRLNVVAAEDANDRQSGSIEGARPVGPADGVMVACPNCRRAFVVELGDLQLDGNLRVACDHCGVEKTLRHFQREFARQERVKRSKRELDAAQRRQAEDLAKAEYAARLVREESQTIIQAASASVASSGVINFEGAYTPSVSLLKDEKILEIFEAGLWDLGPFGWFAGFKLRMVLTNKRLLHFRKRIIDNRLEIIWLRRVKAVAVGHELMGRYLLLGVLLSLWALALLIGQSSSALLSDVAPWPIRNALYLAILALGILVIVLSRRKLLMLSAGEDKISLRLVRIQSNESRSFVEKVFAMLDTFNSSSGQGTADNA